MTHTLRTAAGAAVLCLILAGCTPNTPPETVPPRPTDAPAPVTASPQPAGGPESGEVREEDYVPLYFGALTVNIPKDYTVDAGQLDYTGTVNVDHPAWPDVMDRVSLTYRDNMDSVSFQGLVDGGRGVYVQLTQEQEHEVGQWTLHYFLGRADLFTGEEYNADYYIFFRENEVYELLFLSDGTDSRLEYSEGTFTFEPDLPFDGVNSPRG